MNHRNAANGSSQTVSTLLYQYSFPLGANKVATDLTLPNNTNLIVLGALVTISPSNTAPLLAPISSRTITAGSTLTLTATAADTDQPPQLLTFSLPVAPAGASVDPATGILTWRPGITQAGMNPFTLVVTDSGSPNLSATQTFNVTVNLPAPPTIQPASFTNGQFSFNITGASGPDYLVQASTNLINWITIATNNAPTPPFLWSDPDTNLFTRRFYRILLAPKVRPPKAVRRGVFLLNCGTTTLVGRVIATLERACAPPSFPGSIRALACADRRPRRSA